MRAKPRGCVRFEMCDVEIKENRPGRAVCVLEVHFGRHVDVFEIHGLIKGPTRRPRSDQEIATVPVPVRDDRY